MIVNINSFFTINILVFGIVLRFLSNNRLSMLCKDRKFIFIAYPFVKKMFGAPLMAGCSANGCVKRVNGRCDEPA